MENQVSIIINGVRYEAIDASLVEKRSPCGYCDIFDYCLYKCTGEVCYAVGVDKKIFKKSDKKFNGWQLVTKDNVHEVAIIPPERLIIAVMYKGKPEYMEHREMFRNIDTMAELGGYYYYVLPELMKEEKK